MEIDPSLPHQEVRFRDRIEIESLDQEVILLLRNFLFLLMLFFPQFHDFFFVLNGINVLHLFMSVLQYIKKVLYVSNFPISLGLISLYKF